MKFIQTTSIVRRFRMLTILLGLFLLLEFLGILISSQTYLSGLKKLNRINNFVDLASLSIVNLNTATDIVENNQPESAYQASETEMQTAVAEIIELHPASPKVFKLFEDAQKNIASFDQKAKVIYGLKKDLKKNGDQIKRETLILKQYESEINESLRTAQAELSQIANRIFNDLYSSRMDPVYVALGLALLFIITALWLGLTTSKKLSKSLNFLLHATDEVARGNLNVTVPIVEHDEIGNLSSRFDQMVKNLEFSSKKERAAGARISRLQDITAEFSRALNPEAVGNAVVLHGLAELGASGGFVATLSEDREKLEMLSSTGYSAALVERRLTTPISARMPSTIAALKKIAFFCENLEEVSSLFENPVIMPTMPHSLASVPLLVDGESIGSLTFTFEHSKIFGNEERDFVIALADLASQALQRAQLYDDAQEAIQVREEFLSIASHELKTPITSLKMQLQLAQMQTKPEQNIAPTPQKLARVFEVSINQVNRLTSLVDDLLDVSRFEAGKLSFDFSPFDLKASLMEVLERFDSALKIAKCPAELLRMDEVTVVADTFRIEQVIVNLLSNAMKYGAGKPIEISLTKKETTAELSIRDHGIGIPADKQAVIFGRFERAANTQNIGGLGLGLYIAKQIVEAHHGQIQVQSAENAGSKFTLILPLTFTPDAG